MTKCPFCFKQGVLDGTCPRCRHVLPGLRESAVTCVAMAGGRNTGKSVYIGVVLRQLEQLAESKGVTMMPVTDFTRRTLEDVYLRVLYEESRLMEPTPRAESNTYQRESLVFELAKPGTAPHYLAIRDVAGDDLIDPDPDNANLAFFRGADAVLFLFDPLSVSEVPEMLRGMIPTQLSVAQDSRRVLSGVLELLGSASPRLGVVIAKFDVLQALRDVEIAGWSRVMRNPGAAFVREPSLRGEYNDDDGALLHEEVRSLLHRLHADGLVAAVERAGQRLPHRFFAVSALGGAPSGGSLNRSGITPFRCLDPLRWAMAPQFSV
jgi:hypothetical protein